MNNPETRTTLTPTPSVLLVYEEVPDRTVILLLNSEDLAQARLSYEEIASIHGTFVNSSEMSEAQRPAVHDKVSQAIFGEWIEEKNTQLPAIWESKKIYQSGEEHLCKEGLPPKIDPGNVMVIAAGFVL